MAAQAQEKSGTSSSHAEQFTEQEIQELEQDSLQSELEEETESDSEAEDEVEQHEIEIEALESLEAGEAAEPEAPSRFRRRMVTRLILRGMIRATRAYTRAVVRRMHRNPSLRRKLLAASRRGPKAVKALVGLAVLRAMPKPFRRAARRLIPLVVGLCFRAIARQAGLREHEIDAAELESEST